MHHVCRSCDLHGFHCGPGDENKSQFFSHLESRVGNGAWRSGDWSESLFSRPKGPNKK